MSNKALGSKFEYELCDLLARDGFWAHIVSQAANGQPFDIVASKNGVFIGIDCKVCSQDRFQFSRVEDNQELAMERLAEVGTSKCFFAVKFSDGSIHFMPYSHLKKFQESTGKKSISKTEMLDWAFAYHDSRWWYV